LGCPRCESFRRLSEAVERFAAADVDGSPGSILRVQISLHNSQYTAVRPFKPVIDGADRYLFGLSFDLG
jgi:hypothetical protein